MSDESLALNSGTTMVNEEYSCVSFGLYVVLRRKTIGRVVFDDEYFNGKMLGFLVFKLFLCRIKMK